MRHASAAVVLLVTLVFATACRNRPDTYEECLLDLGRSQSADDVMTLCVQAFPEAFAKPASTPSSSTPVLAAASDFAGEYFYASNANRCNVMSFQYSGELSPMQTGYCRYGSRIECSGGRCRLTCVGHNS